MDNDVERLFKFGVQFKILNENILIAEVDTPLATAKISLYGGHVISWQPKTQSRPILWVSELAHYQCGKAIRGGIPICWPWFGKHPFNANMPSHGYARIADWDLVSIDALDGGEVVFTLLLGKSILEGRHWDAIVSLELKITVGSVLEVAMTTTNKGNQTISYTEGFHTYFEISDIANIRILGLENSKYIDLVKHGELCTQEGAITFGGGELGRIFLNNKAVCVIDDPIFERRINVMKVNSKSTAVWNPGADQAGKMNDFGAVRWRNMVCVESANALTDRITLKPGISHSQIATYSVESMV